MGAGRDVQIGLPVDRVNRRSVLRVDAGRDRAAIGAQPPVLDQDDLVAIDRNRGGLSLPRSAPAPPCDGRAWPSPKSLPSQSRVPAWRKGITRLSRAPGASGGRAASGSAAGTPSSPTQFSTIGTGKLFSSSIPISSPRLNRSAPAPRSAQIGVSGCPGRKAMSPASAVNRRDLCPSAAAIPGRAGASAVAPIPAISSRRSSRKIRFPMDRCGSFSGCYVKRPLVLPEEASKTAIFLLRTDGLML